MTDPKYANLPGLATDSEPDMYETQDERPEAEQDAVAILRRDHTMRPETVKLHGYRYICSGTLISPNILVTAAHCIIGVHVGELLVKMGDYDLFSHHDELYPAFASHILRTFVHPDYDSSVFRSDIALLQLKNAAPVFDAPHIGVACLPAAQSAPADQLNSCQVAGWGHDAHRHDGETQRQLKQVSVSVLDAGSCISRLRGSLLGNSFQLQLNSSFCAASSLGQDTCLGDGGAGLVCADDEGGNTRLPRHVLVGITSWGVDCNGETPGVYTDVASHIDWIYDILGVSPSLERNEHIEQPQRRF